MFHVVERAAECAGGLYKPSSCHSVTTHVLSVCVCVCVQLGLCLFYGHSSGVNPPPLFLSPPITACKTQLVSLARTATPMKHTAQAPVASGLRLCCVLEYSSLK